MPTAIVRYLTESGLVIAADGKTPLNETTKKIFQIKGVPAAYALYGNIGFGDGKDDDRPCPLHIGDEIEKLLNSGKIPTDDLVVCGEKLAQELHAIIYKAKAENLIVYPTLPVDLNGVFIANVFLFGYSKGAPVEVWITFQHRQQVLNPPRAIGFDPRRSNPHCWGSQEVWEPFKSAAPKFARFCGVRIPPKPEEISLLDAAKFGENYILACDSYEGRSVDARVSAEIGGHIHIAATTPTCFHWLKPPIPG
jgi:hypothetical protein